MSKIDDRFFPFSPSHPLVLKAKAMLYEGHEWEVGIRVDCETAEALDAERHVTMHGPSDQHTDQRQEDV